MFRIPPETLGLLAWAAFVAGIVVQIIINRKARKPEGRFTFAAILVVLMVVFEFTQYSRLLPDDPRILNAYGMVICMLVGLAIPAVIFWIRNKRGGNK